MKTFNVNSFLHSLFHIHMIKTNYDQLPESFAIARHYGIRFFQSKNVLVKQPIKTAIVMVMHYFHPVLEYGLPPSPNLNHNAYSIFPHIHVRCESMARDTKVHFHFARA